MRLLLPLICFVFLGAAYLDAQPSPAPAAGTLTGPVTGGKGRPFGALTTAGLAGSNFSEAEYFVSGTSQAYDQAGAWGIDGKWAVTPAARADYAIRMLVRRPSDPRRFNGMLIVEWLNVTSMQEGAADFMQMKEDQQRAAPCRRQSGAPRPISMGARRRRSPSSAPIELGDPAAPDPIIRDAFGIAMGGIRLPQVEAPTARIDGLRNDVPPGAPAGQNFCFLFGRTEPFDAVTLAKTYPTHESFVRKFTAAVDEIVRLGYWLEPEARLARAAAAAAPVGK